MSEGPGSSRRLLTVFDLDGTLVDSRRDLADSANEVIESYGGSRLPEAEIGRMVGDGVAALVKRVIARAGLVSDHAEAIGRYLEIYDRRMLNHTRPYEGIRQALAEAAGRGPVAVLTNKPAMPTRRILDALDLTGSFMAIVGGDDGFPRKPDPEGLQHLMRVARAEADWTLMVGDSLVDVEAARGAGTRVCVARYGFGFAGIAPEALRGDELFVDSADELGPLIARLAGRDVF